MSEDVRNTNQSLPENGRVSSGEPVWRDQYLKERRKSHLFLGSTVVLAVLLVGSLIFAVGQSDSTPVAEPGVRSGEPGFGGGPGGGPGGGSGALVQRFMNPDGSVNEAQVAEFKQRVEQFGGDPQFEERFLAGIQAAIDSGEITQESADELLVALGLSQAGA